MEERLCVKCGARVYTNDPMCVLCSSHEMDDEAKIYCRYNVEPDFSFNWAAFSMPLIWGIVMRQWLWVLVLIAGNVMLLFLLKFINLIGIFNIILGVYLGVNGNKFAFTSRGWYDNLQFNVTQAAWSRAGVVVFITFIASLFIGIIFFSSIVMKIVLGDIKMPNSPYDPLAKRLALFDKGSELSSQVFQYYIDHNHSLPTNLTTDWAAKQSEKIYTNPYTDKPAKQVPYGKFSLGDYSYLLDEKVYKNGGKVGDDFVFSQDFEFYLIVVYGNAKNRYGQEVTGYKSEGIVYESLSSIGIGKERIFVDTISKERFRIKIRDYEGIHIEKADGNGYGK